MITDKKNINHTNSSSNNPTVSAHDVIDSYTSENRTLNSKYIRLGVAEHLDIIVGTNKKESIAENYTIVANNEEHQISEDIKMINSTQQANNIGNYHRCQS